jgi:carbonic anhydrase
MHDHSCCDLTTLHSTRRRFLTLASLAGGVTLLGLAPRMAKASGDVDSVVLSCMDFRLMDDVGVYLDGRGLKNNYDHLILAGASLGAVTSNYPHWGQAFFEHLGLAIKLHNVHRAILIDHRDCGAYRLIFGKDTKGEEEKKLHATQLHHLAKLIHEKHQKLTIETYLMDLDGKVETIT